MSVRENVAYGLIVGGIAKRAALARAEERLDTLGLASLGDRQPSALSGGQQQRVAVARALVLRPRILLFDEPLSNLDAHLRRRVREDIRDLQRRLGLTVVYVTHDQAEALAVSDIVVVMREGRVAQIGSPRELYDAPADPFVADFVGEANVIEAEVSPGPDGLAHLVIGNHALGVPLARQAAGRTQLAVRPEAIRLAPPDGAAGLPGTVRRAAFVGGHMEYEIDTPAGVLFATAPSTEPAVPAGAPVSFAVRRAIPLG